MTVQSYPDLGAAVVLGDCIEKMALLPDGCIDAVVCDPPYAIEFMGKGWDKHSTPADFQNWCQQWAEQCLRLLKPGGHLLAFGGTRTFHRLAAGIEDAGFDIRDSIAWLYGSGMPKSMDVSKAIDKAAGAQRKVVGTKLGRPGYSLTDGNGDHRTYGRGLGNTGSGEAECEVTAPATDAAERWNGWGTGLKPAFEPIVVARKPFKGTVAANVQEHGTGALNIDATRISSADPNPSIARRETARRSSWDNRKDDSAIFIDRTDPERYAAEHPGESLGRWPANAVLDEAQTLVLDAQSGPRKAGGKVKGTEASTTGQNGIYGHFERVENAPYSDSGGASRFFYVAKAPRRERPRYLGADGKEVGHPTVKPLSLMQWLVRMVTPPGGKLLDPFAGSGTTVEAAVIEGFDVIAIELTEEYLPLIDQRMARQRAARAAADDTEQEAVPA